MIVNRAVANGNINHIQILLENGFNHKKNVLECLQFLRNSNCEKCKWRGHLFALVQRRMLIMKCWYGQERTDVCGMNMHILWCLDAMILQL